MKATESRKLRDERFALHYFIFVGHGFPPEGGLPQAVAVQIQFNSVYSVFSVAKLNRTF